MTTSYSLTEDVPLSEEKDGTNSIQFRATKGNVTLSKAKVFAVVVFVIVLLVLVIVLGAILGHVLAVRKGREVHHANATTVPPTRPVPTTPGTEAWWQIRLPDDVIPIHYNVLLNITVKQPRFDGRVEILVNVTKPTRLILVHSWDKTNITMTTVTGTGTARHNPIKNSFFFNKNEFFVMEMESLLEQGQFLVKLEFEAFFSIQPYGLYRKTYKTTKGNESPYAATQFEASQARKAFPCFDEPSLKATFNITIAHSPKYIALSNMPIYKSERTHNQVHDHYMTTVVMPTYLLAFVVGDFKYKEMTSKYGIKMRYYSRPAAINNTDYALSVGGKIMTFFEEHLGVNYSLPKEDQVAIPYFGPGAMENWGLILYAEPFLLWNPETDTEQSKQLVTAVVTHELGHQWFGNILTLKWWSDIWLNEGFAKFFEYTAKVAGEPIWKEHDDIISSAMSKAMTYDGDVTSNPIRVAWKIVTDKMEDFRKVMPAHSTIYRKVQRYLVHQTKGQYNRLGFQDTGNTVDKFERGDVLAIQCRAEVESCVQNATTRFSNWVKDPKGNSVPPNFRSLVFHEGVRGGGVEVWDHVFQQYQKSDSKTTRRQLLYGLAGTQQAWLLSKYLSYTIDTKKIRNDDVGRVFYYVSNYNPIGRRMAWDFVRINWASITARYGGLPWSAYKSVIKTIASGFTTRFQLVELTVFHDKLSGIPLSTKNDVIKVVQENIAWKDHSEKDINNWLTEYMRANNIK